MKRLTTTQKAARQIGHQFVGAKGGQCDVCGLVDGSLIVVGDTEIDIHAEQLRDLRIDLQAGKAVFTPMQPQSPLASATPKEGEPQTATGAAIAKEVTGSMPAGAAPSSVTVPVPKPPKAKGKSIEQLVADEVGLMKSELQGVIATIKELQPKTGLIFSAINKAMAAIHPLAKTETHPDQGFDFRRIDVILAEIQPILVANKLFYAPVEIIKEEQIDRPVRLASGESWVNIFTRVTVRYRVYCTIDGSNIDVVASGEGVSEQQHSTAAAQTMAEKTMLCDLFCIPVYGADDPEAVNTELSQSTQPIASQTTETAPGPQPGLFETGEAAPKAKRKRGAPEPQLAAAGGATLPESTPAVVEDKALAGGMVKIVQAGMTPKGITDAILFAHFKVEKWEDLKVSQMDEIKAFVAGYVKEA
jgi:hypothetical protein